MKSNWYTKLMEKDYQMAKNETSKHDHDAIYAIVRDTKNGAITIEDAVAKIKGLDDGTQLTNDSFEEADNVKKNKESEPEFPAVEPNAVDPGEGADADINNIVGTDPTDDTATLGVVPEDELKVEDKQPKDATEEQSDEDDEVADKRPISKRAQKKLDAKEATESDKS